MPGKNIVLYILIYYSNFKATVKISPLRPEKFAEIVELLDTKIISYATAQQLLLIFYKGDPRTPRKVFDFFGLRIELESLFL